MKLKKLELVIIALTLAFTCFTGGYFMGRRAVGVISIMPESRIMVTSTGKPAQLSQPDNNKPEESMIPEDNTPKTEETTQPADDPAPVNNQQPEDNTQFEPAGKLININTATREELIELTGIGETLAGRIIEYRENNDGFVSISELMLVSGIGEKKFDAIKDYVCVD